MAHVHLIGIGGSGLSAIALLLLERGEVVSGSDRTLSPLAQVVQATGGRVSIGHRAENIAGADMVLRSSAIPDENPEVQAALAAGIPVYKRAEFLRHLTQGQQVIAVAGTHGKTTTTAMLAWMLKCLGQDPSYIIGGVSANLGNNAHAGAGPSFVIEADEYDRMFLGLRPDIAVVTNVEHDHPDCFPTEEDFYQAFRQFASQIVTGGRLVGCLDHPGARRLMSETRQNGLEVISYGLNRWLGHQGPDYSASNPRPNQRGGFDFQFAPSGASQVGVPVSLQVPGMHKVNNALAALKVAHLLGLPLPQAALALGEYCGTGRRFELRGEVSGVTVIDDYAHHPTEIQTTLAAARARFPQHTLWAVWQPHTYSRTRSLLEGFTKCFADAEHVLVIDIYAARESQPADGFSARQVVQAVQHPSVHYTGSLSATVRYLLEHVQAGSVVMVLSAGDADQVSGMLLVGLAERSG